MAQDGIAVKHDPLRHHRQSVRLRGYDYAAPGAYFVTICTRGRLAFFDQPELRACAEDCWRAIPGHAARVTLDEWVVMPNHMHGIIVINEDVKGADGAGTEGRPLGLRVAARVLRTRHTQRR